MAGRRQKPPETLQDRRASRTKSPPVVPDHVEDHGMRQAVGVLTSGEFLNDIPPAPKGLQPETRANWDVFWLSPLRGYLISADLNLVKRYFQYMDERDRIWSRYQRKKTGVGSMGQEIVSPWWPALKDAETLIEKCEAQLGIGPLSRMRLNISFAEAADSMAELLAAVYGGEVGAGEAVVIEGGTK